MNHKVLIFSYYFPPMGMGGTQRLAKFSKYLPEFNWKSYIITVRNVQYYAQDVTLLDELRQVKIYRTGSLDPLRIMAWLKERKPAGERSVQTKTNNGWRSNKFLKFFNDIIGGWLLIPDSKILWLPFALVRAIRLIRSEKIEYLITSSPPQSIHLAGLFLKIFFNISWVADFRDEWTGGESQPSPTFLHTGLNRILEKIVLKRADRVVSICDRLSENLFHKGNGPRSKYITIMNGFDQEDFTNIPESLKTDKFTILHCGSLSKVSNPAPFLEAISEILGKHPELRQSLKIKFVGTDIFDQLSPLTAKFNLSDVIEITGYVPHTQAIAQMLSAKVLLLLVIQKSKEEIITGKVFEYLASGRPILAIIPEGELAGIIRRAEAGYVLSAANNREIQNAVLLFYEQFLNNQLNFNPNPYVATFERKNLTRKLVAILNELNTQRRVG